MTTCANASSNLCRSLGSNSIAPISGARYRLGQSQDHPDALIPCEPAVEQNPVLNEEKEASANRPVLSTTVTRIAVGKNQHDGKSQPLISLAYGRGSSSQGPRFKS